MLTGPFGTSALNCAVSDKCQVFELPTHPETRKHSLIIAYGDCCGGQAPAESWLESGRLWLGPQCHQIVAVWIESAKICVCPRAIQSNAQDCSKPLLAFQASIASISSVRTAFLRTGQNLALQKAPRPLYMPFRTWFCEPGGFHIRRLSCKTMNAAAAQVPA